VLILTTAGTIDVQYFDALIVEDRERGCFVLKADRPES